MRLAALLVVAAGTATAIPLGAADKRDGWYIYWDDNVIFGGPYPSEEICKESARNSRHVPADASCQIIVYRHGVPVNGTPDDLNHGPTKPRNSN